MANPNPIAPITMIGRYGLLTTPNLR